MLKTKPILSLKESSDGFRISIMSRHTLEDGLTSHPLINTSCYDLWLPIFAPPTKLLGDYYKRGLSWDDFSNAYQNYLKLPRISVEVQNLAVKSLNYIVTLLCVEDTPEYCHRRLLAEECKKYSPHLSLIVK